MTIYNFVDFTYATGLNEGLPNPNKPKKKNQIIGSKLNDKNEKVNIYAPLPVITGATVVDRTLADPDYLKEMYSIDEAVDTIMGR